MEGLVIAAIIIGIVNLYRYYKQNQAEEEICEVQTTELASSDNTGACLFITTV